MFGCLINESFASDADDAVVGVDNACSWADLRHRKTTLANRLRPFARRRVGLVFRADADGLASLGALADLSCDAFLLSDRLAPDALREQVDLLKLDALVEPDPHDETAELTIRRLSGGAPAEASGDVILLTSGSTGTPKVVRHSWTGLSRPVRARHAGPSRWLLSYRANLYAGLQVILQCFSAGGTLVVPAQDASANAIAQLMRDAQVSCASATTSYWRRLILFADRRILGAAPLRQITLGGEVVDQPILDALHALFPQARLVHIYATSELGRCFAVRDGKAGFPAALLDTTSADGVALRIDDGELVVRSANAMLGYDGHQQQAPESHRWRATGDLVALVGDRVMFTGRSSDTINVGGNKVHPIEVERVLRDVPGVADVRVFGKRSSIAGELVSCEVVTAPAHKADEVRAAIVARCADKLTAFQRPRLMRFVDHIDMTGAFKTKRIES